MKKKKSKQINSPFVKSIKNLVKAFPNKDELAFAGRQMTGALITAGMDVDKEREKIKMLMRFVRELGEEGWNRKSARVGNLVITLCHSMKKDVYEKIAHRLKNDFGAGELAVLSNQCHAHFHKAAVDRTYAEIKDLHLVEHKAWDVFQVNAECEDEFSFRGPLFPVTLLRVEDSGTSADHRHIARPLWEAVKPRLAGDDQTFAEAAELLVRVFKAVGHRQRCLYHDPFLLSSCGVNPNKGVVWKLQRYQRQQVFI